MLPGSGGRQRSSGRQGIGADSEKIRNEVIRMLSGPGGRQRSSGRQGIGASRQDAVSASEASMPELGGLSDEQITDLITQLTQREQEISYERRILRGKIDLLRYELKILDGKIDLLRYELASRAERRHPPDS